MAYEIDFLAIGEESRSGDAITLRFGDLNGPREAQTVVVVDGGFTDDGVKVIKHLAEYYHTDRADIVVSTHPDGDHAAGLAVVLNELSVGALWMHQPWNHTDDIAKLFKDGRVTDTSVAETIRKALDDARDLEKIALRKGIPIVEPFVGSSNATGELTVVGPSIEFYESLLPQFLCTPEPKESVSFLRKIAAGVGTLVEAVAETLTIETLTDDGDETSAENESSVVLRLNCDAAVILLTGDVGRTGLGLATDVLEYQGFTADALRFIQVPHHGSKRNVGPTVLDRLLGPKRSDAAKVRTGFVSVAKDGAPKHPAKKVINAFLRRGTPVHATQGQQKWHHSADAPVRENWVASTPLPFYDEVDE